MIRLHSPTFWLALAAGFLLVYALRPPTRVIYRYPGRGVTYADASGVCYRYKPVPLEE